MTILPPLLSLFALACTGAPEGYTPLGDKADEAAVNEPARSGEFLTQLVSLSDSCGLDDGLHEAETVEIIASADGEHFEYEEDGTLISCDRIDDGSYQCGMRSPADSFGGITTTMTMDAKWTSEDQFEGALTVTLACSEDTPAEFCDEIAAGLPNGLPCTLSGEVIATPLLADDFEPSEGNYTLAIGDPREVSTCAVAFPVTPEQNALLVPGDSEGTIKLFDDDGGALAAFDCDLINGAADCTRTLDIEGLSIHSEIMAVFSDSGSAQGSMEVTLGCTSDDQAVCDDLEANFGELPCRSVRAVAATLEEATSDQPE